jgi:twitching motility protein PilT
VALELINLLNRMVEMGASDLHLKVGSHPGLRIDGKVKQQVDMPIVMADETESLLHEILSPDQVHAFDEEGDLDCAYTVAGLARFRINVLTQRGTVGLVLRVIPDEIPELESLGLPQACMDMALKPRGLVLVTGPTGSGKSTTLAAMVDYINRNVEGHILTMEDPLEFLHDDKLSYVTQREIGTDCKSFQQALRRGLRQDPDVILIGELRDLTTIELALTAAETGHLVMGTLHTTSAISTVDRIIDVFPTDAQDQVRVQLSNALQGVISQGLIPKIGGGRVAATEVLICTDGVRSLIREGKTSQMLNFLQTGAKYGMNTLEQSLVDLVNAGVITAEDAVSTANRPQDVRRAVRMPPNTQMDPMAGHGSGGAPPPPARQQPRQVAQQPRPASPPPQQPSGPQGTPPQPGAGPPRRGRRKGGLFDRG